jgi:hypothetical protein
MFHTHLVCYALALLPSLYPTALGKWCMFMFVLEVLDGDGPGPFGSGSFFSITKKSDRSCGSQHKSGPPGPSSSSHSPLPSVSKKEMKAAKADERDRATRQPPALATPVKLLRALMA